MKSSCLNFQVPLFNPGTGTRGSGRQLRLTTAGHEFQTRPVKNIRANANDRDSKENGEGVTSGTQEKERSNDRVEEVDEVEVGNRKRKRQDSASPLSRLIKSCRRSSNL